MLDKRLGTLRSGLRHASLNLLALREGFLSAQRQPSVQILLLHHVNQNEEESFRKLLGSLWGTYQFIDYSSAVHRILHGDIDGNYLALSFDDGQRNCLRAASIMEEFGLRGCFFVCPPLLVKNSSAEAEQFCKERLWHEPVDFLSWKDAEELLDRGHEIGGHTMSHRNLGQISPALVKDEISICYEELNQRLGLIQHFAWPYGRFRDFSLGAANAVFQSGFISCASGVRGAHAAFWGEAECQRLCLYRQSIECSWPISHILCFLRSASRHPLLPRETWPEEFAPVLLE